MQPKRLFLLTLSLLALMLKAKTQTYDDNVEDFPIIFVDNFDDFDDVDSAYYDDDLDINSRSDFGEDGNGPIDENEFISTLKDESDQDEYHDWYKCDKDLRQPHGLRSFLDWPFLKKIARNLNPFSSPRMQMHFYLFKREFPDCGRELDFNDLADVRHADFDATLPTRIVVHGWMSQSRGSFNRDVKDAYLQRGDFNVIVADWSASAANLNYFQVVKMIEEFGAQLALFTQNLNQTLGANFDDMYIIGHSLGAQIAGAAGKRIKPAQYNTIFALDPAGPKFRRRSIEFRIDPTDAKYVESMQTSALLGFLAPTGSATFYPNYGAYQRKCYYVGCSHIRAYKMFAESINSPLGFWGTPCRRSKNEWQCNEKQREMFRMGGEPSVPKQGLFYVKTNTDDPFALGRRWSK